MIGPMGLFWQPAPVFVIIMCIHYVFCILGKDARLLLCLKLAQITILYIRVCI